VLKECPTRIFFAPSGKLVAEWQRAGDRLQMAVFERPGELAEKRFEVAPLEGWSLKDGKQGCQALYDVLPFVAGEVPLPAFSDSLTPAFRKAFQCVLERDGAIDDFWVIRGEPGVFAVVAQRRGATWRVCGLTGESRTLTVRFEDLWLRMPAELRSFSYTVEISRDPNAKEQGAAVEESFTGQAPDIRIFLDLSANGGFLLTFRGTESK
jgi:hypothetical protein